MPATGRVTGPSCEVRLEPRVMAVLELLALHSGELVTRQQLLDEIWPGGDVYDDALTQCVYQLRQQLLSAGGSAEYRNLVTTVPKRGYILNRQVRRLAKVVPIDVALEQPITTPPPTGTRKARQAWLAGLALVLLAAAFWAWFAWQKASHAPLAVPHAETVAVLPFLPLAENDRNAVLELGMADTLISRMSAIDGLVVRPMSSVRRYGDLERDVLQAGRQLGVQAVVDGSIQRSGETIRVTARLLRVADGSALWAETMSGSFDDIFAVQDEICTRIANALALKFGQEERRHVAQGGTANPAAYEHYIQARYHLARLTPRDLRASVQHFSAAVELDPGYLLAWLGLANAQFRSPIAGEMPALDYYPRATEAARRALELDPNSAEAHAMLGWIAHWFDWDWAASEAYFKRAIELNPNDTESHLGYAHLLSTTGRFEEATIAVRRARELSPNYMAAAALEGGFLMGAGKFEEALRYLETAREVGENMWLFRVSLAGAYYANGRVEDALEELAQAKAMTEGGTWIIANEIGILLLTGRTTEAEAEFSGLLELAQQRFVPPYDLAVAHGAMGDFESALAMLERALEVRDPKLVFILNGAWGPLHDEPRFQKLLKRMNPPGEFE